MKRDLRVSRTYPHPRALVWRALTEPELLAEWLMPNDFRAEIGHAFTFTTKPAPGFDGIVHCEVLAIRAPELLQLSWRGGSIDTRVTFRLEDAILYSRAATRVVLEHTGFEGLEAILTSFILEAGWRSMEKNTLARLLDRLTSDVAPTASAKNDRADNRGLWCWLARALAPIQRRLAKRTAKARGREP